MNLITHPQSEIFLVHKDYPPPKGFVYGFGVRTKPNNINTYITEVMRLSNGTIKVVARIKQVHSNRVVYAGSTDVDQLLKTEADAIITDVEGIAVAVSTADCLPLLVFANSPPIVGAIHAGWRGVLYGVIERSLEFIANRWALFPEKLTAVLGPAISVDNYQVSPDLAERFKAAYGNESVRFKDNKAFVSISAAAQRILLNSGIKKQNIYIADACTYANKNLFFSYRREKEQAGRQLSFAAIINKQEAEKIFGEIEL